MRKGIAVIGDITLDIIANTTSFPIQKGTSVLSEFVMFEPGGNGNTLIAAQRLGGHCISIGYLGNDVQADISSSALEGEGVDMSKVVRQGTTTIVVTLTDLHGNHAFHGKSGVGPVLGEEALGDLDFSSLAAIYFTGYTVHDPLTATVVEIACKKAKDAGCSIVLDPGPEYALITDAQKKKYLSCADYFLLTRDEIPNTGFKSIQAIREAFPRLRIIEKNGKHGCIAYELGEAEPVVIPAHDDILAVDTSGAGDSFAGGFLAMLEKGKAFTECAIVANCVGEVKVQKVGCGRCVPTLEEVQSHIAKYNVNVSI